jgi:hypothetical protein
MRQYNIKQKHDILILATLTPNEDFIIYKETRNWKGGLVRKRNYSLSNNKTFVKNKHLINSGKADTDSMEAFAFYHLHIVSDKLTSKGEYFVRNNLVKKCAEISNEIDGITYCIDELGVRYSIQNCKTIIATTDKSLLLPEIGYDFVLYFFEQYTKENIITEVFVEYKESQMFEWTNKYVLYTNDFNQVAISYSKTLLTIEEHRLSIKRFAEKFVANTNTASKQAEIEKWLDFNYPIL